MKNEPKLRDFGVGFLIAWVICALVGTALLGVLIWLAITAASWLQRN